MASRAPRQHGVHTLMVSRGGGCSLGQTVGLGAVYEAPAAAQAYPRACLAGVPRGIATAMLLFCFFLSLCADGLRSRADGPGAEFGPRHERTNPIGYLGAAANTAECLPSRDAGRAREGSRSASAHGRRCKTTCSRHTRSPLAHSHQRSSGGPGAQFQYPSNLQERPARRPGHGSGISAPAERGTSGAPAAPAAVSGRTTCTASRQDSVWVQAHPGRMSPRRHKAPARTKPRYAPRARRSGRSGRPTWAHRRAPRHASMRDPSPRPRL